MVPVRSHPLRTGHLPRCGVPERCSTSGHSAVITECAGERSNTRFSRGIHPAPDEPRAVSATASVRSQAKQQSCLAVAAHSPSCAWRRTSRAPRAHPTLFAEGIRAPRTHQPPRQRQPCSNPSSRAPGTQVRPRGRPGGRDAARARRHPPAAQPPGQGHTQRATTLRHHNARDTPVVPRSQGARLLQPGRHRGAQCAQRSLPGNRRGVRGRARVWWRDEG